MARGKQTCKILKEIRRQIAEANGIEFATSECRYKSDCLGTCPKCEAEVRYLEQQLRARSLAGKAVALAGISAAALAMLVPMAADAHPAPQSQPPLQENITVPHDTIRIKGTVWEMDTLSDGSVSKEPLVGAFIINHRTGSSISTDLNGRFCVSAAGGDSITISGIGYESYTFVVNEDLPEVEISISLALSIMGEWIDDRESYGHYLDLNVVDENGNDISVDDFEIERIWTDEEGEECYKYLHSHYIDEKHPSRIYWQFEPGLTDEDGNPIKEATLSIEADDYEPKIIKVKYPKTTAKKTIRLKRKKN